MKLAVLILLQMYPVTIICSNQIKRLFSFTSVFKLVVLLCTAERVCCIRNAL